MEVQGLVEHLRSKLPSLMAVYAFGSYANGTARPESDLDLALLTETPIDPVQLWRLAGDLAVLNNRDVDLVDLRNASTVLQHQVITTGQRLWCRNDLPVNLWEVFVLGEKLRLDVTRGPLLKDIRETGVVHAR